MPTPDEQTGLDVIAFAKANFNKQVGDGQCFSLADKALRKADAMSAADFGKLGKKTDYVWGDPVDLSRVQPGDILQFRDFNITTTTDTKVFEKNQTKSIWLERTAKRGHHTAI